MARWLPRAQIPHCLRFKASGKERMSFFLKGTLKYHCLSLALTESDVRPLINCHGQRECDVLAGQSCSPCFLMQLSQFHLHSWTESGKRLFPTRKFLAELSQEGRIGTIWILYIKNNIHPSNTYESSA